MTTPADPKGHDRRMFLRGVAGAGATTTVLVMTGSAVAGGGEAPETAQGAEQGASQGYHVTSHIETYYDKAQF
ncbi:MAG: formate dehydrogenase [Gammaproteobacteria bacterium]|nr:formate dehydrogenase [Gammaproteobacteria bacterium]